MLLKVEKHNYSYKNMIQFNTEESVAKYFDKDTNPLCIQNLILSFYDSVNYSFVDNLVIGSYDITHYELEKHYSDYNDEADNLNINKIMPVLMGSSLRPEINYNRPKLCVIWNLYISPEFRRRGIGGWLVENLEDILFFYTGTRTCGFVAFPCPGGKNAYEKESAPDRTDEMYQDMVNLIERYGFAEIDNTNYFFKKCDEEV